MRVPAFAEFVLKIATGEGRNRPGIGEETGEERSFAIFMLLSRPQHPSPLVPSPAPPIRGA